MKQTGRKPIWISVVESDPVRVLGLSAIFSSEPDMQVRAATIASVLHSPDEDVVLMSAGNIAAFKTAMAALKAVQPGIRDDRNRQQQP